MIIIEDNKDKEIEEEKAESWEKEELKNIKVPPWLLEYIKSQQKPDENISDTLVRLLGVISSVDRCLAFASDEVREIAKEFRKKIEKLIENYRIKFKKNEKEGTESYIYVSKETDHPIAAIIFGERGFRIAYRDKNDKWAIRKIAEIYASITQDRVSKIMKDVKGAYRRWGIKENQWEKIA